MNDFREPLFSTMWVPETELRISNVCVHVCVCVCVCVIVYVSAVC